MKRSLILALGIVIVAVVAPSSVSRAANYGLTISASSTDPFDNTPSPAAPGSVRTLYLHLWCNRDIGPDTGVLGFESGFEFTDAPLGLTKNPDTVIGTVGDLDDLILLMGECELAPNWLISWTIIAPGTGMAACFRPSDPTIPGFTNQTTAIDCVFPHEFHAVDYIGFDSTGGVPCEQIDGAQLCQEGPITIEETPWGAIKGLYR